MHSYFITASTKVSKWSMMMRRTSFTEVLDEVIRMEARFATDCLNYVYIKNLGGIKDVSHEGKTDLSGHPELQQ